VDHKDLLERDENLFTYKWLFITFIVVPPIIVAIKEPHAFVHSYVDLMLFALSWPLLLLAAMYFFRRRFLTRLMERGREVEGTVRTVKASSGKLLGYSSRGRVDRQRVQVAVRIDGAEKLVDVDVPRDALRESARVTLLVDPLKPRHAILIKTH
jgi:hypothetical protein